MKSLAVLALAAMLAIGSAPATFAQSEAPARLDDKRAFKSGEDAWNKVCARCHLVDGETSELSVGPDLSHVEYDYDTIAYFVRNGSLAMPAFTEGEIDNATLAEIVEYMAANIYHGE